MPKNGQTGYKSITRQQKDKTQKKRTIGVERDNRRQKHGQTLYRSDIGH